MPFGIQGDLRNIGISTHSKRVMIILIFLSLLEYEYTSWTRNHIYTRIHTVHQINSAPNSFTIKGSRLDSWPNNLFLGELREVCETINNVSISGRQIN